MLLEAINTMFSGQCQEKGIDYQCHISSDVEDYYIGDGLKLRQVLINVIGNAVKFTEEGGVSLDVKKTAGFDSKSTLLFEIADTGIGMNQENIPSNNKYQRLSMIPPDSEYVFIWVRTGVIGVSIFAYCMVLMLAGASYVV